MELLRERETALERREEIVRRQAERIGRLEREVELLRAQRSRAAPASTTESTTPSLGEGVQGEGFVEGNYEGLQVEGVHDEAVALASQVARLRGDLRSLAVHLEERTSFAPARPPAPPAPLDRVADPPPAGSPPPLDSLTPSGPVASPSSPAPSAPSFLSDPDPFAEAAAAIRQLQVALQGQSPAPRRAVQSGQSVQHALDVPEVQAERAPPAAVASQAPLPLSAPETPPPLPAAPVRRPWWRFWR